MDGKRDPVMTALTIAMGLMAASNLWKPMAQHFAPQSTAGFVFFGHRLHGAANAVVGPAFGVLLAAYAYGVGTRRRFVVPLAIAYAVYVPINLVLFTLNPPPGSELPLLFMLLYALVAVGISGGGALYLYRNRARLA